MRKEKGGDFQKRYDLRSVSRYSPLVPSLRPKWCRGSGIHSFNNHTQRCQYIEVWLNVSFFIYIYITRRWYIVRDKKWNRPLFYLLCGKDKFVGCHNHLYLEIHFLRLSRDILHTNLPVYTKSYPYVLSYVLPWYGLSSSFKSFRNY